MGTAIQRDLLVYGEGSGRAHSKRPLTDLITETLLARDGSSPRRAAFKRREMAILQGQGKGKCLAIVGYRIAAAAPPPQILHPAWRALQRPDGTRGCGGPLCAHSARANGLHATQDMGRAGWAPGAARPKGEGAVTTWCDVCAEHHARLSALSPGTDMEVEMGVSVPIPMETAQVLDDLFADALDEHMPDGAPEPAPEPSRN